MEERDAEKVIEEFRPYGSDMPRPRGKFRFAVELVMLGAGLLGGIVLANWQGARDAVPGMPGSLMAQTVSVLGETIQDAVTPTSTGQTFDVPLDGERLTENSGAAEPSNAKTGEQKPQSDDSIDVAAPKQET